MLHQGILCRAVHKVESLKSGNPTKLLLRRQPWFDAKCQLFRQRWHNAHYYLGAKHSNTHACYAKYAQACTVAVRPFDTQLPKLLKSNPNGYYDCIYPNRGTKVAAECSASDYQQHYKRVFELPADIRQEIVPNPDQALLPFLPSCM